MFSSGFTGANAGVCFGVQEWFWKFTSNKLGCNWNDCRDVFFHQFCFVWIALYVDFYVTSSITTQWDKVVTRKKMWSPELQTLRSLKLYPQVWCVRSINGSDVVSECLEAEITRDSWIWRKQTSNHCTQQMRLNFDCHARKWLRV